MQMIEQERELLADIFTNLESLDKVQITLDSGSRSVTIVYKDCDDEWFREFVQLKAGGGFVCGNCGHNAKTLRNMWA
jgi:hypothetical protein